MHMEEYNYKQSMLCLLDCVMWRERPGPSTPPLPVTLNAICWGGKHPSSGPPAPPPAPGAYAPLAGAGCGAPAPAGALSVLHTAAAA